MNAPLYMRIIFFVTIITIFHTYAKDHQPLSDCRITKKQAIAAIGLLSTAAIIAGAIYLLQPNHEIKNMVANAFTISEQDITYETKLPNNTTILIVSPESSFQIMSDTEENNKKSEALGTSVINKYGKNIKQIVILQDRALLHIKLDHVRKILIQKKFTAEIESGLPQNVAFTNAQEFAQSIGFDIPLTLTVTP